MSFDAVLARLQWLENERDIRALITGMAAASDARDIERHMAGWAQDAVYELPGAFRREGAAAIRAALVQRWSGGASVLQGVAAASVAERHHVTDMRVTVAGDSASAVSAYIAVQRDGERIAVRASGLYLDQLVRRPRGWLLERRQLAARIP